MANINASITISNGIGQTLSSIATNGIYQGGLLVDWRGKDFTNDPQTTSLVDRSGNGRNGNASNFTYNGTTNGSDGNGAIIFGGNAVNAEIGTTNYIASQVPVIEAVFTLNQTPVNWASVVTAYDYNDPAFTIGGIAFFVHSDYRLGLHFIDSTAPNRHFDLFSDVTFVQNRKYHAVLQYENGNLDFYLNGVLRKRVNYPNLVMTQQRFFLGNWTAMTGGANYNFAGKIHEARAYSAPLTIEQIQNNAFVSGAIKVAQVAISNGPQLSFGYTSSQPQNKMASVTISNGTGQALTGKKGGLGAVTVSNGFQITLSYMFAIPEHKTASVTISNGPQQTIAGLKNGRAPPMAISNGTGQTLAGIAGRKTAATISIGTQQTLSYVTSKPKNALGTVLITNGIIQGITTKKGTAVTVAISNGAQIEFEGIKKTTAQIIISNGFGFVLACFTGIPFVVTQTMKQDVIISMRDSITATQSLHASIIIQSAGVHETIVITLPDERGI